jgi:alkylation response protein AidB-like acyl-CoA dehydrogenase
MSDEQTLLDAADRHFKKIGEAQASTWSADNFNADAWSELDNSGFVQANRSEARGGSGLSLANVAGLIRLSGRRALQLPLSETYLAEWALAAAGLDPVDGPATIAPALLPDRLVASRQGSGWVLNGVAKRVPWGRHARHHVAVAQTDDGATITLVASPSRIDAGKNLAGEPRDTLTFQNVTASAAGQPSKGLAKTTLYSYGALFRSLQIVGALEEMLELSLNYAQMRVQFGSPISKFQAVQQQLAVLAAHITAASAATDGAVEAASLGGGSFEIACAKSRVGEAAGLAAGISHQVHGAIGVTQEYPLHLSTTRVWSWRDEFGSEREWAEWIGRNMIVNGGQAAWSLVTALDKQMPVPLNASYNSKIKGS